MTPKPLAIPAIRTAGPLDELDAEVIVVGAGPAGSTCARKLAELGRRVILLDKARFPRDKTCGGWVNLKVFEDFPELEKIRGAAAAREKGRGQADKSAARSSSAKAAAGKSAAAGKVASPGKLEMAGFHGLIFHSTDMVRSAEYASRSIAGFTVRRSEFDATLLQAALAAGPNLRFHQHCEVVGLTVDEERATVATSDGRRLSAQVIIGADGAHSTVARLTGMRERWSPERQVVCLARDVPLPAATVEALYGHQRKLHVCVSYRGIRGYAWAFPKRDGVSIGVGYRPDVMNPLPELYDSWVADLKAADLLPARCETGRPQAAMEPSGGAIDSESHVSKHTLLVGDAGGFVSAVTGEGIYPGMLSARVAAACVDQALRSRHPQDTLLDYKFAWRQSFAGYIQMPSANLAFLLPLIYDNKELCRRLAESYLFGKSF